jgi:hypothetical protein
MSSASSFRRRHVVSLFQSSLESTSCGDVEMHRNARRHFISIVSYGFLKFILVLFGIFFRRWNESSRDGGVGLPAPFVPTQGPAGFGTLCRRCTDPRVLTEFQPRRPTSTSSPQQHQIQHIAKPCTIHECAFTAIYLYCLLIIAIKSCPATRHEGAFR